MDKAGKAEGKRECSEPTRQGGDEWMLWFKIIDFGRKQSFLSSDDLFITRSGVGNICPVDQIDQHPLVHPMPVATSGLQCKAQQDSWVIATEATWNASPKYFLSGPWQEVCWPLHQTVMVHLQRTFYLAPHVPKVLLAAHVSGAPIIKALICCYLLFSH